MSKVIMCQTCKSYISTHKVYACKTTYRSLCQPCYELDTQVILDDGIELQSEDRCDDETDDLWNDYYTDMCEQYEAYYETPYCLDHDIPDCAAYCAGML